ncbi:MAG: hypothetical protein PHN52_03400 [candidate division Zixibacteria bacterium]|nr:hypothetical protein [candidate division Zixibacteria bacterium]
MMGRKDKSLWLISTLFIFNLYAVPAASQTWDVEDGAPPASSSTKPLPKPTPAQPFKFLAFNDCITGKPVIDIMTVYGSIGFVSSVFEDTVILDLKMQGKREHNSEVYFPSFDVFFLKVIMGGYGDAVFKIDISQNPMIIEYAKKLNLLRIQEIKELPENTVYIQFMTKDSEVDAGNFLEDFKNEIGESAEIIALPKGFYRCLPIHETKKVHIGGRRDRETINKNFLGHIIVIHILNTDDNDKIVKWVYNRQQDQIKKAAELLEKRQASKN